MNQSKFNKQEVTLLLQQCLDLSPIYESEESYIFESEYDFNDAISEGIAYLFEQEVLGVHEKNSKATENLIRMGVSHKSPTISSTHKTGNGLNKSFLDAAYKSDTAAVSFKSAKGYTTVYHTLPNSTEKQKQLKVVHTDEHGNTTVGIGSKSSLHKTIYKLHGIDSGEQTHSDISLHVHKADNTVADTREKRATNRNFKDRLVTNAGTAAGKLFNKKHGNNDGDYNRDSHHNKTIHAHTAELLKHHENMLKTSDPSERQRHLDKLKDTLENIRMASNDYHYDRYAADSRRAAKVDTQHDNGPHDKTVRHAQYAKDYIMQGKHSDAKFHMNDVLSNLR